MYGQLIALIKESATTIATGADVQVGTQLEEMFNRCKGNGTIIFILPTNVQVDGGLYTSLARYTISFMVLEQDSPDWNTETTDDIIARNEGIWVDMMRFIGESDIVNEILTTTATPIYRDSSHVCSGWLVDVEIESILPVNCC